MQVLRRALGIQEQRNDPSLATTSSNLAAVYFDQGDYRNAEAFFQRALAIDERTLDAQHPTLATQTGRIWPRCSGSRVSMRSADPLYERALDDSGTRVGPDSSPGRHHAHRALAAAVCDR